MFLKKEVALPGGSSFTFQGEVSEEELNFIIEEGLLSLLEQGALPFTSNKDPSQLLLDLGTDMELPKMGLQPKDFFEDEDEEE